MATATKIVVHFDDGSSYEIDPRKTGSIFMNEKKAERCGHRPPWDKPPHPAAGDAAAAGGTADATTTGGSCYLINGIIVCP